MKIYLLKKENNDTTVRRGRGIYLNYIQQYAYLDYITFVKNISVKKENNGTKVRRGEAPSENIFVSFLVFPEKPALGSQPKSFLPFSIF